MSNMTNCVSVVSSSSISDPVGTIVGSLVSSRSDTLEDKKSECLKICRAINSVSPGISNYLSDTNDLPDAFMVFSFYDKLRFIETMMQSVTLMLLDSNIADAQLDNHTEVELARRNIKTVFQNFENNLARLREIAPTLSINRPIRDVADGHIMPGIPPIHR